MLALISFVLLAFMIFHSSSRFRYYTKVFYFCFACLLVCTIALPLNLFRKNRLPNIRSLCYWMDILCGIYDIKWELKGVENLQKKPFVIVANHQNFLDLIGLFHINNVIYPTVPVIKSTFMYYGTIGLLFWKDGAIFVERSQTKKAKNSLMKSVRLLQEKQISVLIFPEGTRNDTGSILKFKKGAFHLAIEAQIPILPLVFSSYSKFYDAKKCKFDHGGKIVITALPPISTKGKTSEDVDELSFKVRSQMLDVYHQNQNLEAQEEKNLLFNKKLLRLHSN